jgi:hypothetical protein
MLLYAGNGNSIIASMTSAVIMQSDRPSFWTQLKKIRCYRTHQRSALMRVLVFILDGVESQPQMDPCYNHKLIGRAKVVVWSSFIITLLELTGFISVRSTLGLYHCRRAVCRRLIFVICLRASQNFVFLFGPWTVSLPACRLVAGTVHTMSDIDAMSLLLVSWRSRWGGRRAWEKVGGVVGREERSPTVRAVRPRDCFRNIYLLKGWNTRAY